MTSKLSELRHEREQLAQAARAINAAHPNDKPMPKAEAERLDTMLSRIEQIDKQVDEIQARHDAMASGGSGSEWGVGSNGQSVRVLRTAKDIRSHYAQRISGRDESTLVDFLRGVAGMPTTESVRATLTEGTDSAGGYSVPTRTMPGILEALVPNSTLLRAGAGIVPLEDGAKSVTTAAIDTIPTAAWRAESGSIATSEPTFRAITATPRSLAFMFKVSRELLMDSANINGALQTVIAQAFAKELDRVGLRGTGSAPQPAGLLNNSAVTKIAAGGANGAFLMAATPSPGSGPYRHFITMLKGLLADNAPNPTAAIMHPDVLMLLENLVNTDMMPVPRPRILQDLPFLTTSQIPVNLTTGTSTDTTEIYMGDFSKMHYLMRERLSVQMLNEKYADTGEIGFVAHMRCDVVVDYPKALNVLQGLRSSAIA